MRRFRVPEIALGFLAATALWAIFFIFQPKYIGPKGDGQSANDTELGDVAASKNIDDRLAQYTFWLVIFTAVLAGSTILLWVETRLAGKRQSRDMKASIDLARDEFVSTHRPKLIIRDALAERGENDERIYVQFTIVNIGETRATVLHSQVYLEFRRDVGLMLIPNAFGSSDIATDPIEAGETRSIFWLGNLTWSDEARAQWSIPLIGLFFVGQFIYRDDAGIRRQTAFRRRYLSRTERFERVNSDLLGPEHEYAD